MRNVEPDFCKALLLCVPALAVWCAAQAAGAREAAAANAPGAGPPAREWFVVEEFGQRRARGVTTRRPRSAGRMEVVEEREDRRRREGIVYETREQTRRLIEADGLARRHVSVANSASGRRSVTVTIDPGRGLALYDSDPPPPAPRPSLPVPPGLRFGLDAEHLPGLAARAGRELSPGLRLEAPILDLENWRVATESVVIRAVGPWSRLPAPVPAPEPSPGIWPAEAPLVDAISEAPGRDPVRMILAPAGRLLWLGRLDGSMAWRAVTREEYERVAPPANLVTRLAHGGFLPAWDAYDRLDFELVDPENWQRLTPEQSEYARLATDPAGRRVAVLTAPRNIGAGRPPPPGAWLESSDTYPFTHPAVARAAREAAGFRPDPAPPRPAGQPEAVARLAALAGWIRREITGPNRGEMVLGPVETLAERRGHCGEHARLLISLCRYWKIPARLCQGLTTRADALVYHAWVEAWAGGRWVPVDTTAGLLDFGAGYWLTARETPDGDLSDPLPGALQAGRLRLAWLAAGVADSGGEWHFWHRGQAEPPVARRGEGAFDLAWGAGMWEPPPGWRLVTNVADAGEGAAADWRQGRTLVWENPGAGLTYRLQAGPGTFRADDWTGRRLEAELGRRLNRFRRGGGGVDIWPGAGGRPREALRLDYRWRAAAGQGAWARQWDVPLPERRARAVLAGTGDPLWEGRAAQRLCEATRLCAPPNE